MNLGRMYEDGIGVGKDLIAAYEWFHLAAGNGEGVANHYLMQLEGRGPVAGPSLTPAELKEALRRVAVSGRAAPDNKVKR